MPERADSTQRDSEIDPLAEVDASYAKYVETLEPCPECGRVDEMDNITGQLLCAACYLDQQSPGCELCGSFSDDCDCWEAGDG